MQRREQPLYRNVEASRWHLGRRRRGRGNRCKRANMEMNGGSGWKGGGGEESPGG